VRRLGTDSGVIGPPCLDPEDGEGAVSSLPDETARAGGIKGKLVLAWPPVCSAGGEYLPNELSYFTSDSEMRVG